MYRVGIQTAGLSLLRLSALMILAGGISVAAQNPAPVRSTAQGLAAALPHACLTRSHTSEKVSALLDTVQDHPTAGAYNTLGALYAQEDLVSCAIPAFETSLKLESQNWEAHYNLALALLRKG